MALFCDLVDLIDPLFKHIRQSGNHMSGQYKTLRNNQDLAVQLFFVCLFIFL